MNIIIKAKLDPVTSLLETAYELKLESLDKVKLTSLGNFGLNFRIK